ncbi:MAG: DUF1700 domain-containing protein [Acetivibrionales bacterium]
MNRNEFIERLTKKLRDNHISDIDEIIAEYQEHFAFKLADGYSEEEIAAKLGKPEVLAEQFVSCGTDVKSSGKKAITVTGLFIIDIFVGAFFILLWGWVIVMSAFSIASFSVGICLIGGFNIYSLIPAIPYHCSVIFAVAFFALSILSAVATFYCASFSRQLMRAYGRFHKNCVAAASGNAVLPSLAAYPQFKAKTHRRLRNITFISLAVFAVAFISAYITSMITAGAFEFWHEWNWFVE